MFLFYTLIAPREIPSMTIDTFNSGVLVAILDKLKQYPCGSRVAVLLLQFGRCNGRARERILDYAIRLERGGLFDG